MTFDPYDPSINYGDPTKLGKPGYNRALAAGYTPEEINMELMKAQSTGGIVVGPNSGYVKPSFNAIDPTINKGNTAIFGAPAYARATEAGWSDEDIQAGIDATGVRRGRNVPGYVAPPKPSLNATNTKINRGRPEVWGMPATARAQALGYSTDEINSAVDSAGIKTTRRANAALGRPNPKAEQFDQMLQGF